MLRYAACAALLLLSAQAMADAAAAARLGALMQGMHRFQAEFSQKLIDERGVVLQQSDGHISVQHPGHFRWETREPFAQLVVSDGQTVWQYDPDLQQAVKRPLDRRADQLPSLLLSGDMEAVDRAYEVVRIDSAASQDHFELTPLQQGEMFTTLSVMFSDGILSGLAIADGMGQKTELSFSAVDATSIADAAAFTFLPPPDVDVIIDE